MGQTTKEHYVPQFYLRNFTVPDRSGKPVLWVYDKNGGVPRSQTPQNTMAEYGFYDFENNTGDIQALDKGIQKLETATAPILKRLEKPGVELTNEDVALLASFLAIMYLRVPRTLKAIEEHREIFAFEALKYGIEQPDIRERILYEYRERYGDRAGKEDEILKLLQEAEKHYRVEPDREDALVESMKFIAPIAEILCDHMNWTICRAPSGSFFISSDAPICVVRPTGPGRAILGGGFGHKDVQISFPISPQVLLFINRKSRQHHITVGQDFIREKNKYMAWSAERWVIANMKSRTIEALVKRAAFTRKLPKLDRRVTGRQIARRLRNREIANTR